MTKVLVLYYSSYGHLETMANAIAEGAKAVPGAQVDVKRVPELVPEDVAKKSGLKFGQAAPIATVDELANYDAIIFGAPTYMGSPSAVFKAFEEAAVGPVWAKNLAWRDKIAAGFTNSKAMSGDKLNSLLSLAVFAAQHGMIWVGLDLYPGWTESTASIEDLNRLGSWMGAMAQSDADLSAEKAPPETDLRTAEVLGARVARITLRQLRGAAAA
jgi:NAD(P)H:quinone oxidoreductase type IV